MYLLLVGKNVMDESVGKWGSPLFPNNICRKNATTIFLSDNDNMKHNVENIYLMGKETQCHH